MKRKPISAGEAARRTGKRVGVITRAIARGTLEAKPDPEPTRGTVAYLIDPRDLAAWVKFADLCNRGRK